MTKRGLAKTGKEDAEGNERNEEEATAMPCTKRGRTNEDGDGEGERDGEEGGDCDEDDDEDEEEEYEQRPNFVAWLEDGATSLSVGELHFSKTEHTGSPDAPNSYCVVYELNLLPPPETEEDEES
eukprot:CAMPEP_0201280750 /NCGR_PEP_ID=MMETSP0853-20130426/61351_1 /ASSEMBLY_ACC=CAM_ASM_000640 /TAXON_ID=183588 /ORGANISM="Pseudo-nitzschia fraudulenta, Strain WWA7" /LENGTH=124 /DNA_ID=CAMNT_0047589189 /DNA_START=539 /DNA_END=909 /DNA_ORIENTATION=+